MTEHALQKSIVDFLELVLPASVRVVAVANKPRSAMQGRLEKERGAKKGFPDLLFTGSFHGLMEVKVDGGALAREQREWRDWCGANQVPYAVVRGIPDVINALADWGVNCKITSLSTGRQGAPVNRVHKREKRGFVNASLQGFGIVKP